MYLKSELYNFYERNVQEINLKVLPGHFRVVFCLCIKTSVRAKRFIDVFCLPVHFHGNQTHIHLKGLARGLVLKQVQEISLGNDLL